MIPIKICNFCQKEATYAPLTIKGVTTPDRYRKLRVHYCTDCAAEYVYWENDGQLAAINLYVIINAKMYRWSTTLGEKVARLWYVKEPGLPGVQPNKGLNLLKSFEDHPDLTPENVAEKIKFMLPFL
jgi:hypothetical protein